MFSTLLKEMLSGFGFCCNGISSKIKEAIHIKHEHPSLNSRVKHVNLKLYL